MTISDADYKKWLERPGKHRCALFELTFLGSVVGSPTVSQEYHAFVANMAYVSRATDAVPNQIFRSCVLEVPAFTRTMNEQLAGRSSLSYSDLIVANNDGERDQWLAMNWDGRRVRQWLGDPAWAFDDFRLVLDGIIVDIFDAGGNKLGFKISDKGALLNRPLVTTLLGGDGPGAGGLAPLALGSLIQNINLTPMLIDQTNRIYKVSIVDPGVEELWSGNSTAVEPIQDVRENGSSLRVVTSLESSDSATDLLHITAHGFIAGTRVQMYMVTPPTPLLNGSISRHDYWVSSDGLAADDFKVAPTLADALAGTNSINITGASASGQLRAYNWTHDETAGTVQIASNPSGTLTADVYGLGDSSTNYVRTAGAIMRKVINSAITYTPLSNYDVDAANLAAFEALCSTELSIWITERTTFADLFDKLVLSVGGFWTFSRDGLLRAGRLDLPSGSPAESVYSFDDSDIAARSFKLLRRILPKTGIRVTGGRNYTLQQNITAAIDPYYRAVWGRDFGEKEGAATVTTWDTDPTSHINVTRPDRIETLIAFNDVGTNKAEADRLASLYQYPTGIYSFLTHQAVFLLELGDEIYVDCDHFTGYGVVVGIAERVKGRSEIRFFAQIPDVYPSADLP